MPNKAADNGRRTKESTLIPLNISKVRTTKIMMNIQEASEMCSAVWWSFTGFDPYLFRFLTIVFKLKAWSLVGLASFDWTEIRVG